VGVGVGGAVAARGAAVRGEAPGLVWDSQSVEGGGGSGPEPFGTVEDVSLE